MSGKELAEAFLEARALFQAELARVRFEGDDTRFDWEDPREHWRSFRGEFPGLPAEVLEEAEAIIFA